jgi:Na+-transporting methylmalonyl-CoA/oxaloacetate decarboxylase gamma subunit
MINSILLQGTTATQGMKESAKSFSITEPSGLALTMIIIGVVFAALILLYFVFNYVAKRNRMERRRKYVSQMTENMKTGNDASGEVNAAIALALHLYRTQLHDNEDARITMQRVARAYSPWSSKIYGLTRPPR